MTPSGVDDGDPRLPTVVGIGASAGGLAAFQELLANLPATTGMAYGLIQHLDPSHESFLPDILARTSRIPIVTAREGLLVEPDHAYVIPPGTVMTLADGHLSLESRKRDELPHPIDAFFESLADVDSSSAIGVVLSGTGTDGARGIEAVKEAGGITFAQDFSSAQHDAMPRAAVATGSVDFVLSPADIAAHLTRIASHPLLEPVPQLAGHATPSARVDPLSRVLDVVRARSRIDFRGYKRGTMQRRVLRRMLFRKVDTLAEYLELLRRDPEEIVALRRDLLINVTRFFRNPAAFQALTRVAFPALIDDLNADETIRAWVPGCATGEEAYSIAICLKEYLAQANRSNPIQVFGSDLSEDAISVARRGVYSPLIETDVSSERLDRFFARHEYQYAVNQELRTSCTFARQDVTMDPPFAHLHLVSCRNVLIYFRPDLQARTLSIIHYALNPNGILFLGPSESVGAAKPLFATLDKRHHLYARRERGVSTELIARSPSRDHETSAQRALATARDPEPENLVEGEGARPGGQVTPNVPPRTTRAPNRRRRPAAQRKGDDVLGPAPKGSRKRPSVASLEKALAALKRRLKSTIEEHESEIEELRAADEEIQSSNEELQSATEELETAKEELQSINEELTTVNDELQDRNGLLNALNDDLNNVAASIRTPVVIVTLDQRIRRYTAGAERLMNLIPTDIGRPIADLRSTLDSTNLSAMISEAIDSLHVNEADVQDRAGRWYSMVVRPYKTSDQRIDGAVIVFHDIDARKTAAMMADAARKDAVDAREVAEQAQQVAEDANRAKGDFLASMSHELRTPLNAITGYAQLIDMGMRGPVSEEQHADLARIARSAAHLLSLIRDVLSFARIEAGHVDVEVGEVPVHALLTEVAALTLPQVVAKDLRFVSPQCDDSLMARGDADRILQIVINLVSNAVKFTPRGGEIALLCDTVLGNASRAMVRIQVRDTGIGVAPDKLEAIFEPFVQDRHSRNEVVEGIGLGLAISRKLARAMDGDLTVESVKGQGSTFTLTLPQVS